MRKTRTAHLMLWLIALAPLALLVTRPLDAPIDGAHFFRQAHVAANIEMYVRDGLSLHPSTYNKDVPSSLYDFPLFQIIVAAVARWFGFPPLPTARVVGILAFLGFTLSVRALLRRCQVPPAWAAVCVGLVVITPLDVFYFPQPMVDGLALTLSFVSLVAFLGWQAGGPRAVVAWVLMLLSGVASTLIKNPVYFPVCFAIAGDVLVRKGWRGWRQAGLVVFGVAILLAVVGWKLFSDHVNGTAGFWAPGEAEEYFAPLSERLDPSLWAGIAHVLGRLVLSPPLLPLFVLGVAAGLRHSASARPGVVGGLLVGAAASLLVFFGRNQPHSYYQLPLVFILCYFAVEGMRTAFLWLDPRSHRLAIGFVAAALCLHAWQARAGLEELSESHTANFVSAGLALRSWTAPNDFVIYLVDSEPQDWSPAYLYYAQRDGYNVTQWELSRAWLDELHERFASRYRRVFVFAPPRPRRFGRRLEQWGYVLASAGPAGRLYRRGS